MSKPSSVVILSLIVAAGAFCAPHAAADLGCNVLCYQQEKACLEKAKESPNSIDRELCESDKQQCLTQCFEQNRLEDEQKAQERALKEQEEKLQWDSQGYTPEQQQEIVQKRIQQEQEREEAEEQKRKDDEQRAAEGAAE